MKRHIHNSGSLCSDCYDLMMLLICITLIEARIIAVTSRGKKKHEPERQKKSFLQNLAAPEKYIIIVLILKEY